VTSTIQYSPATATSGNVIATPIFNKSGVVITSANTQYVFTGNGIYTFTYRDPAGNTGSETAFVNRIDTTAPSVISLTYNPAGATNLDVTATLTVDEALQTPE
jgi:hypothetical protein